jgi:hypothetical protein
VAGAAKAGNDDEGTSVVVKFGDDGVSNEFGVKFGDVGAFGGDVA